MEQFRIKDNFFKTYWLAIVIPFVTFIFFFFIFLEVYDWAKDKRMAQFDMRVSLIEASMKRKLNFYTNLLKTGRSYLNNSDTVSRESWKDFMEDIDFTEDFQGLQGIGYGAVVKRSDTSKYEELIRKEGLKDFKITTNDHHAILTPIIFIEPINWRNKRAFGYDMYSEPVRREALDKAMLTGEPTLSGKVFLVQETEKNVQPGFLVYLPVYSSKDIPSTVEERRKKIKGFVYSPFRAYDFLHKIFSDPYHDVDIEIYDGLQANRETLLYNSDNTLDFEIQDHHHMHKMFLVKYNGHQWTLFFTPQEVSEFNSDTRLAYAILLIGIFSSILILFVIISILNAKRRESDSKAKLSDQNKELIKINTDLDNFIYAASHDLKAPVSNIEALVNQLRMNVESDADKDDSLNLIRMLEMSAIRFKSTISDLTDIAKIQKLSETEDSFIEVKETIDEAIQPIMRHIKASEANLQIDTDHCKSIRFSKSNFKSIIYNLVSNSIKYRHPERKPVVLIKCRVVENFYYFEISDNGLGFSEKNKPKMFSMFKRFHDHVEGTGIGLYIVKRILDNAGGRIEVDSTENVGSVFRIYIPLKG